MSSNRSSKPRKPRTGTGKLNRSTSSRPSRVSADKSRYVELIQWLRQTPEEMGWDLPKPAPVQSEHVEEADEVDEQSISESVQPPKRRGRYNRMPKVLARRGGVTGRPPGNIRPKFSKEDMEIAINVAMFSKVVYNWVVAEAEAYGVELNTDKGRAFFKRASRKAAENLLS